MDDLNLIPYEVRIDKERKIKKMQIVITLILVVFTVGVTTFVPIYVTYDLDLENRALEREIQKFSHINEQMSALNDKKKFVEMQSTMVKLISKDEIKWTEIIEVISSTKPGEISIDNIYGEAGLVSMRCSSHNIEAIALFCRNLQNSNRFTDVRLKEIIPDEMEENYKISISFKLESSEDVME